MPTPTHDPSNPTDWADQLDAADARRARGEETAYWERQWDERDAEPQGDPRRCPHHPNPQLPGAGELILRGYHAKEIG